MKNKYLKIGIIIAYVIAAGVAFYFCYVTVFALIFIFSLFDNTLSGVLAPLLFLGISLGGLLCIICFISVGVILWKKLSGIEIPPFWKRLFYYSLILTVLIVPATFMITPTGRYLIQSGWENIIFYNLLLALFVLAIKSVLNKNNRKPILLYVVFPTVILTTIAFIVGLSVAGSSVCGEDYGCTMDIIRYDGNFVLYYVLTLIPIFIMSIGVIGGFIFENRLNKKLKINGIPQEK